MAILEQLALEMGTPFADPRGLQQAAPLRRQPKGGELVDLVSCVCPISTTSPICSVVGRRITHSQLFLTGVKLPLLSAIPQSISGGRTP
ncbi:hypothetical protein [Methylacidimicrobium cyclopophantes]|uniref:hypothetical protein n=1 Tax=Methylacidimicrobium cyclopophantes TaxID=1041766 RepID=UPI00115B8B55|nr:hypothetical protein [Methylacidimicrobium cyclopophantes]